MLIFDDWSFMPTFVHMVGWMGRETPKVNEAKLKMKQVPFRYAHAEIRTQVVVIRDPTCYQLD